MNRKQKPIYSGFGETTTASEVISGRDLTGKVVVITGGHSGIGLETTKGLSGVGASIVIGARHLTKAREAVSEIKNVEVYELDVAGPPQWMNSPTNIASHFINATFSSITLESWRRPFCGIARATNCNLRPITLVTFA